MKIANDLKKYGIVRNKTKKLKIAFSKIPKKYLFSFLRGCVDGDGTIGIAKSGNIWCQIATASEIFAKQLYDIKECNFSINYPMSNMYVVRVSGGNKNTIKFLKKLYSNKGDMFLRRKYEKVQDIINS
jgi:intein/homing endonuclease